MENNTQTLEQYREEKRVQQEKEMHKDFLSNMENKTLKELNIKQQTYLYNEHNTLYNELHKDDNKRINDLITLDRLTQIQKANNIKFEQEKEVLKEQCKKEQENKSAEQRKLEELIDNAFNAAFEKYNLN